MDQYIAVKENRVIIFELDREVYRCLFENTIVHRDRIYSNSLEKGSISLKDFVELSRKGEVPYPLFFLEKHYVEKIVDDFKKRVYFGVSKEQLSISSRGEFSLADISLILKDITRKQNFIKDYLSQPNYISGRYGKSKKTYQEEANEIRSLIGYDIEKVFKLSKENSFALLSDGLAKQNVFISLYVNNYSPQTIDKRLQFSGIAINDKKCPFLFIKAGDYDSKFELWGRRLFTAALLLSCLLHSECRPVTMDSSCKEIINNRHFLFAEEFLMPQTLFSKEACTNLLDVIEISNKYSVSPTAAVMRLYRLKKITRESFDKYYEELVDAWNLKKNEKHGMNEIGPVKAINRYNNQAIVEIIIQKHSVGLIDSQKVKNLLCFKKGEHINLEALRNA